MKRFALSLLFLMAGSAYASNFMEFIPTPASPVQVGGQLTVAVDLFSDDTVFGFQFDLVYPTFLSLNPAGITEQGFFQANGCCFTYDTIDNADGTVTNILDVVFGPNGLRNTLDTLVQFQFDIVGPGSGQISLQNIVLADDSLNSLPVDAPTPLDVTALPAPEPGTLGLMAAALAGLVAARRRFKSGQPRTRLAPVGQAAVPRGI